MISKDGFFSWRQTRRRIQAKARNSPATRRREPSARAISLQLKRKSPALAESTIRRRLQRLGTNELERALLLELLGAAQIAQGDFEEAIARGRKMAESGVVLDCRLIVARGERLWGHALATRGDFRDAQPHLERALTEFVRLGMPFETACTHLLLAEALRTVDPEVAAAEARSALATFEDLEAGGRADASAALLRELGVRIARGGPRGLGTLTKREQEVLTLLGQGLSNPEIAEWLYLSRKTVEHHVAAILSKLGARNRAEAAAEAIRRLQTRSAAE